MINNSVYFAYYANIYQLRMHSSQADLADLPNNTQRDLPHIANHLKIVQALRAVRVGSKGVHH